MRYIVTPVEEPGWRADPSGLRAAALQRWPGATVEIAESVRLNERPADPNGLSWWLQPSGVSLAVEASLDRAAETAAWFREQVPAELELILCDESYDAVVTVRPGMKGDEIVRSLEVARRESGRT